MTPPLFGPLTYNCRDPAQKNILEPTIHSGPIQVHYTSEIQFDLRHG
jgi:hypothetical protein